MRPGGAIYYRRKEAAIQMITDEKILVHQCAWCRSLIVDGERIPDIPGYTAESHGICKVCACSLEMQALDIYNSE